jgi:exopolyphosphatase/guanosine-5'-triphosphate,3'-diphosphate pyrophosphatase
VETAPAPAPVPAPAGRLAAIDIGSNSIHMIVVEALAGGGYRVLDREKEMVRLGRGLARGRLGERAMRDALVALTKMTTLARLKGAERTVAAATSAAREAANGDEFLARVRAQTGLRVRVLSGEQEGRLVYLAVREAVDLGPGEAVIVDLGGGSTEWIATRDRELRRVVSLRLGSLRCAQALAGDPPTRRGIEALRRSIRLRLRKLAAPAALGQLVATSGTAVCVADLADQFSGRARSTAVAGLRELRAREVAAVVERLRRMPRRDIAALAPVGGPRSESVLAGAVLLHELVLHAGADRFLVSDRALRDGLVRDALGERREAAPAPGEMRRRQVLQLAGRAEAVAAHAAQTARLAARLFDLTVALHRLGAREREWLEYAALLHDIGYVIDYEKHHKHGYYLITSSVLDAFDPREIEIIAHLVRYHRGARPGVKHASFRALKAWQRRAIEPLAALLRIADALDRSHARRIDEVYCSIRKKRVRLEVLSPYDVDLELATARRRAQLFEEVFERKLELRQGLGASKPAS